jgi:hypothetical protein
LYWYRSWIAPIVAGLLPVWSYGRVRDHVWTEKTQNFISFFHYSQHTEKIWELSCKVQVIVELEPVTSHMHKTIKMAFVEDLNFLFFMWKPRTYAYKQLNQNFFFFEKKKDNFFENRKWWNHFNFFFLIREIKKTILILKSLHARLVK